MTLEVMENSDSLAGAQDALIEFEAEWHRVKQALEESVLLL